MLSKVRDFANVNQYIMHYLNHTVTMVAYINHLYIPQKKALLSILTSVILTPLLCFITLKLSKLQINYLQFLLIGYIYINISQKSKKTFASKGNLQIPSVQATYGRNDFYIVTRTCNDIQKEMKGMIL